jgi:hypothetical protein
MTTTSLDVMRLERRVAARDYRRALESGRRWTIRMRWLTRGWIASGMVNVITSSSEHRWPALVSWLLFVAIGFAHLAASRRDVANYDRQLDMLTMDERMWTRFEDMVDSTVDPLAKFSLRGPRPKVEA